MSDQTAGSGLGNVVKQFFSPPVLAALRYLLTAISPLLAIVGVVALSPQQIDHIISVAQQVGVVVGALAAFIGVVAPIAATIWGTFKSTQAQQVKSAAVIATGPASAVSVSAQQAMIAGTSAIAQDKSIPTSSDAKDTLIAATIALDSVQTIVTDKATADRQPSASVIASDKVMVVPTT